MTEVQGKAKGGEARAKSLTAKQRRDIAMKGVVAKKELSALPRATHGSSEHPLLIGDVQIPCYVLDNEMRVLSQRGLQTGVGMSASGGSTQGEQRLVVFFTSLMQKDKNNKDLAVRIKTLIERLQNPIKFRMKNGGPVHGYEATILADICDEILSARSNGLLQHQQTHFADKCEVLVRGFARVGIIALVDEATGYEKDRVRNALANILEAFIAKELQPWLRTFPAEFYEEMCRLRGLPYTATSVKRPQYFGTLTNNIIYDRLAPGVKEELKSGIPRNPAGRPTAKYFQKLTRSTGYPKLREHLGSVVTLMKLSEDWDSFMEKMERIHPKQTEQNCLDLSVQF